MKRILLTALCIMPLLQAYSEYSSALELMKVFTNPAQKADKNFEYWIEQLRYHVARKDRFTAFETELKECLNRGSSQDAFRIFTNHKSLFQPSLQVELFKMGLPKIKAAFNERLVQHKKHAAPIVHTPPMVIMWQILKNAQPLPASTIQETEEMKKYSLMFAWLERKLVPLLLVDQAVEQVVSA